MVYSYKCYNESCGHEFDKDYAVDDRNKPLTQPCPNCQVVNVKRNFRPPALVSGTIGALAKTDSGWNDMLGRIKKSSGKNNTIGLK